MTTDTGRFEPPEPMPAPSAPDGDPVPRREPAPTPDSSGDPADLDAAAALPRAMTVAGSIVAPTTLLTALLFYFGLLYAVGYYRHFGVNVTALDLPVQAFLIVSADAAVLPLALLAGATLLSIWIYRVPVRRWSHKAQQVVRWAVMPAVGVLGAVLVALAAVHALFGAPVFPAGFAEARGLSFTGGVLLLAYAARLWRVLRPERPGPRAPDMLAVVRAGCLFLLVSVGLFWAVGSYAVGVGAGGAQGLAADLACVPEVVLYSEKSLNLQAAGLTEEPAPAAAGFRYPGLKLVPQSGSRYFLLLPADWAKGGRPAILLPRSDGLRLEFLPAAKNPIGAC
jgi:hypothetical protein